MKKLLIILMVVAMAAFLFVGCMPGVTPDVDDDEDEDEDEEPVVPTTTIAITSVSDFDITSTSTLYVNKTETADGLIVSGNAATLAEVKVYIDGVVCAATANVSDAGTWTLGVTKTELGADGLEKTLYAVASEAGLADATSTVYTFVKDTVAPGIEEVKATADGAEELPDSAVLGGNNPLASFAFTDSTGTLVVGTWNIHALKDSSETANVVITPPAGAGVAKTYTILGGSTVLDYIPGVDLEFVDNWGAGDNVDVIISSTTGIAVVDRYTLKFNEDVTTKKAVAGHYEIFVRGASESTDDPSTYKESNDTGYWDDLTGVVLNVGDAVTFTVYGISDLAGNPGGTSTAPLTKTCNAGVASTALKP